MINNKKLENRISDKKHNYDFEKELQRNPEEVIKEWKYDKSFADNFDKDKIFNDVKNEHDYEKILYEIALWKINRRIINDSVAKDRLYGCKNVNEDAISDLINDLTNKNNHGIGLPMASTILHFFSDGKYPIMDQRACRVVYKSETPKENNLGKLYLDYYKRCQRIYADYKLKERKLDFRDIDKYLYQIDKNVNNKND